jgi:hypothetical protein
MVRNLIIIGIVLIYLMLVVFFYFHAPMLLLLRMLPPLVIVGLLLRHTPKWVKIVVGMMLVVACVYVLFNNDIKGPMEFALSDRPFDMPAQFHHSWRYFWLVVYLHEVSWMWGITSSLFLLGYKSWRCLAN